MCKKRCENICRYMQVNTAHTCTLCKIITRLKKCFSYKKKYYRHDDSLAKKNELRERAYGLGTGKWSK